MIHITIHPKDEDGDYRVVVTDDELRVLADDHGQTLGEAMPWNTDIHYWLGED